MAGVAAFLMRPDAACVTGADLMVDGGLSHTVVGAVNMNGWQGR